MLSNKSIPSTYITRTFTRNIARAEHIQAVKFTRLYNFTSQIYHKICSTHRLT